MKTKIIIVAFLFIANIAFSQEKYLWPIPEKQAGDDILYRPQDYIGVTDMQSNAELVFSDLIIGAGFGTPVVSPVDGTISFASLNYHDSYLCSVQIFRQQTGNYEQDSLLFLGKRNMTPEKIHNLCLSVSIVTPDGEKVSIDGMRPIRLIKTGEKIHRGDTLGTVGYLYRKIKQPCIGVSISKNSNSLDPMTPFGLETTFILPKINDKQYLNDEEVQNDINGMMAALNESFPGLYDYTPKEEFDRYIKNQMSSINDSISISDFEILITKIIGKVRDSHTTIISESKIKETADKRYPSVCIGWFNDTLKVWRAVSRYKDYLGKEVISVNGIPADSLKNILLEYVAFADGFVKSYGDYMLLNSMDTYYCGLIAKDYNLTLTFADGETKLIEQMTPNDTAREPKWIEYQYQHLHINEKANFEFEMISDTVAYIALHTFELNDIEQEQIAEIFSKLTVDNIPHLIFDIRYNHGGPSAIAEDIYSYLAQKPFCTSLRKFINNKSVQCYGNCPIDTNPDDLFPDYEALPDGGGFVNDNPRWIEPDTLVNYKGRLYVLTNESSFSASTCLAGWVKKENRGVIVGRETGSTYHFMKAINFTQYHLPNSHITIQIPIIKVVFDTVVDERFPYGRGVMPDYHVNFTPEELSFSNGDAILNYTLQLIRDGKYIYYKEIDVR